MPEPRPGGSPHGPRPRRRARVRSPQTGRVSSVRSLRTDDVEDVLSRRLPLIASTVPFATPDPAFRAELRAQLVAVSPRLIAEGPLTETGGRATPATANTSLADRVRGRRRFARPALVAVAAAAVLVVLLGASVVVARHALPGDALYGLKRANESVALSVTRGDDAKGRRYLSYATRRTTEVADLVHRTQSSALGRGPQAGGSMTAGAAKLISDTLQSADADSRTGTRLVTEHAVDTVDKQPLSFVADWADAQNKQLTGVLASVPSGPARDALSRSIKVVSDIHGRVTGLNSDLGCGCLTGGRSDQLGPVPCGGTQCRPPAPPLTTSSPLPVSSAPPSGSSSPRTSPSTSSPRASSAPPSPRSSGSPSSAEPPPPSVPPSGSRTNTGSPRRTGSTPPRSGHQPAPGPTGSTSAPSSGSTPPSSAPTTPSTPPSSSKPPVCVLIICLPTLPNVPLPQPKQPTFPNLPKPLPNPKQPGGNNPLGILISSGG